MDICKVNGYECYGCQPACDSREQSIIETDEYLFEQLLRRVGCKFFIGGGRLDISNENISTNSRICIKFDDDGKFEGFASCE